MSAFRKQVLAQLQCKVCFNYMIPPIRICSKGHSACDNCANKFRTCVTCKYPFLTTRNYALEEISNEMDIECTKCRNFYPLQKFQTHMETCEANVFQCKKEILHENYLKKICKWMGSGNEIVKHFEEHHKESLFKMDGQKSFQWVLPYKQDQVDVNLICMGENNFLHFVYYDYSNGKVCFSLADISENEESFSYEVHVNDGANRMVYKRKVDDRIKTQSEMINDNERIEVFLDDFTDYNVNKRVISWVLIVHE